jgi:hypothetical protein
MGERMAAANDLSVLLRSTARQDKPSIPVPPAPVRTIARRTREMPLVTETDDFKEVLRVMRSRYLIRK